MPFHSPKTANKTTPVPASNTMRHRHSFLSCGCFIRLLMSLRCHSCHTAPTKGGAKVVAPALGNAGRRHLVPRSRFLLAPSSWRNVSASLSFQSHSCRGVGSGRCNSRVIYRWSVAVFRKEGGFARKRFGLRLKGG